MKIKLILSAILLTISAAIFAQKPVIVFTDKTYDFGTISEEDGKVSHVFEFQNTGTSDLVLTNVQASCGCTTPQWSREPIAPKGRGTITVTYSAAGRPGSFTKSITVTSNADRQVLIIKGNVTPRGKKVEDVYPVENGPIRLQSSTMNFGDVAKGESKTAKLAIANTSDKDATVSFDKLPKHFSASSQKIKAGEKTNIDIIFNTANTSAWGPISDEIEYTTGNIKDKSAAKFKLTLTGNIFEKFTEKDKENAPTAQMESTVNMGDIKAGSKFTYKLAVKNTGKTPLIIRSINSSFSDISTKLPGKIAVGKTGYIKVTVDAKKLAANSYNKFITVQTNDPKSAKRSVALVFKVVK